MTVRSQRRAAEVAVLDAAAELVAKWGLHDAHWHRTASEQALADAVEELERVGLASATGTPVNRGAPDTAHDAARWMSGLVNRPVGLIYAEIAASPAGLTVDQLEQRLHMTHQTASARVNQLRDAGWIVDSGNRRLTRSGRRAIVWKPTQFGIRAAALVGAWGWQ